MTSWALVADIYFLPPQKIREGESGADFANRVQAMIADVAKLRPVPWDGYLKYYNLAEKVRQRNRCCLHCGLQIWLPAFCVGAFQSRSAPTTA